jgi:hypothetical protein
MQTRRSVLTASLSSPLAALPLVACDETTDLEVGREAPPRGRPLATFVSCPDLFNGDVGDLSVLPTWDGGDNSINDHWRAAIDRCLGAVASYRPQAVLVAGDLVEGRWNLDTTGRELFGPVSQGRDERSLAQCRRAITRAGAVYYGHYTQMFAERGLRLLPAVGDHEILDDRSAPDLFQCWSPGGRVLDGRHEGERDNRYYLVPHAKRTFADHFTTTATGAPRFAVRPRGTRSELTAYAVDLGPALRVITVDVFTLTRDGVRLGVFGEQLAWLRRTIRAAKRQRRVVVVQGHVPILHPYRSLATGDLHLPEGTDSTLYRVLAEEGVDFYFSGEVHDTTVQQRGRGPIQISHGAIFRYAFNFLVGRVYADRTTTLELVEMTVLRRSADRAMWCTDQEKRQSTIIEYGGPQRRGQMVVRDRRIVRRTQKLGRYDRDDDPYDYETHLAPEII